MAFARGGTVHGEVIPAYVHLVLRPLVQTFGKFLESNETTVDPYVAVRWSAKTVEKPVSMTEDELEVLRTHRARDFHYIDCTTKPAQAWVGDGNEQVVKTLTAGEKAVFLAAFAASREGDRIDVLPRVRRPVALHTVHHDHLMARRRHDRQPDRLLEALDRDDRLPR